MNSNFVVGFLVHIFFSSALPLLPTFSLIIIAIFGIVEVINIIIITMGTLALFETYSKWNSKKTDLGKEEQKKLLELMKIGKVNLSRSLARTAYILNQLLVEQHCV